MRNGKTFDTRRKSLRYRMLRLAGEKVVDLSAPPCELGRGELRVRGFVDGVIDLTAEGVQGRDGGPALGGQEKKRVVEARAAGRCFLLAILIGIHIALRSSRGQSKARRTGLRRKTSYPAASVFSRIRNPPWTVARISRPMRPGSLRPSCCPDKISSRERSTWNRMRSCHDLSAFRSRRCVSATPNRAISSCGR